ncbi:hypothetical protein PIB30_093631, partial [Stylosanthes scabra]|nr:hypothetical protein [Stylosanthes scabra]
HIRPIVSGSDEFPSQGFSSDVVATTAFMDLLQGVVGLSRMISAPPDFWVDDPSTWSFQLPPPSLGVSIVAISARKSDIACALTAVLGRNWMSNWDNSTAQLSICPARSSF